MTDKKAPVVVITGASAGVGRATAREFAKHGAHIGLVARDQERLEEAQQEVEQNGGKALVLPTDVSDANAVEEAAVVTESEFGPIDVWVNNAMASVFSPVIEMTPDDYKRVTEVTYLGYVYGTLAALKRMVPRDRGTIVQVGSALAYRGIPLQSAYCAAKHAIQGFNDSLRSELIHDNINIHVTMVQMPALNTPQFGWVKSRLPNKAQPVPPIFQPEVAARSIVWAAHHHPRELYVGRSTFKAVVLNKLAPGIADWYLARSGYKSQQTEEPRDKDRPNNLWKPVPGKMAAHGNFDSIAQGHSLLLNLRMNYGRVLMSLAGIGSLLMSLLYAARHNTSQAN